MKLNRIATIFSFLSLSMAGIAQNETTSPYTVAGVVDGLSEGTEVYLANYYGNKLYYNDTAMVNKKGEFSFAGKPFDEQGKYAFVIPGPKYFDFIVADEDIYFETDTSLLVPKINFKKSLNNQVFFEYIKFISDQRKKREPWMQVINSENLEEEQKQSARDNITRLNDEVIDYQKDVIQKHSDLLAVKFIRMTMEVEIPEEIPAGQDTTEFRYNYYKKHYWDNCDLTDNRMVREQSFHGLLDTYINKVISQAPDSIIKEADLLIDRVKGQPDLFKYIVHFMTYNSETSKLMCMDAVFVHLIDTYYKTGAANWMEADKLADIIEKSDKKKNTLCNETFPRIILPDSNGVWKGVHDVDSKYTVVFVWESSCGHCKKEVPKLMKLYEDWKDHGVDVYAIGNDYEREDWLKFIHEKGMQGLIHVSDDPAISNDSPDTVRYVLANGITNIESLNFRQTLDISSTPVLYVLDEDKSIIAKRLNSEQIHDLFVRLEDFDPSGDEVEVAPMEEKDLIMDEDGLREGEPKKKENKKSSRKRERG